MYNKVELCGVNTGQLPVLTEAEKRQLLTLAHAGDKAARARMVEGNLRLVLSVVQRFAQRGENLDDLFQVGCIGLIKAIDNFDPAQPVRFSTYGVPMIIGEIRRFLRDNNALRVSRTLRDTAYRAMQARETLEKQLGREPTMDEIAAAAGLARREVTAALESVVEPLSLDELLNITGDWQKYKGLEGAEGTLKTVEAGPDAEARIAAVEDQAQKLKAAKSEAAAKAKAEAEAAAAAEEAPAEEAAEEAPAEA